MTATVSNPSAFFGTTITTFQTAHITITTSGGVMTEMVVIYTTANGSAVTLTATFA